VTGRWYFQRSRSTADTGSLEILRVCIDETIGRRVARLSNLDVTGFIGILLKAKSAGYPVAMSDALNRMRERGIWLSKDVFCFALVH
jgi:predicted nucleic acid-binding protein